MKKTTSVFMAAAMAVVMVFPLALRAEYTDYYLIGSDVGNNCPLDGTGTPKGWAASADGTTQVSKGATDPDGIYHVNGKDGGRVGNTSGSNSKPGVIRGALAKPSANYTFEGHQLVFDGFCPSVQIRQDTGKTVTFGNVRVVSGVNGEFRNGRGNITPIVDCLFTNCWCGGGNGPVGAVIRALGANCLVDRCILLDSHYVHDAATVTRAALYVNNGIVRNTVVARSRLTGEGGILAAGSAKVQNCTVVDNVSELTGYVAGIKVEGSATVKNTILWNNVNAADNARAEMGGDASRFDHCFTEDPGLVGKRGREFQIRSNSPCRGAGVVESWMTGALDLYRQPRIDNPNRSVDIGAAECQRTDGTMLIMR